jgi:hypothetical protein
MRVPPLALACGMLALSGLFLVGTALGATADYVTIFGGVARDGTPLPPTPTPTPAPEPPPFPECYEEPEPGTSASPADGDSVLRNCQVVAYYGYPGVPALGVLGEFDADTTAAHANGYVAAFDAANGARHVVGAYHLIVAVAQGSATADGSWLSRMPPALIEEWIAAAERNDFLVILDIQMGHSTVDAELDYFLPYLGNPRVHLALDPEWAMPPGVAPGTVIGGMDAAAINRAQERMSAFIAEHGLANRMLIVHQFVPQMIRDKAMLGWYPGVDLVIDTDGFGTPAQKVVNYDRYIAADGAPFGGMKLFFDEDTTLMTPAEVNALAPLPAFVVYQ